MRVDLQLAADYLRGLSSPEQAAQVENEARSNPAFAAQLARLRRVAEEAERSREGRVSDFMINRAKAILPLLPSPRRARITFDSWALGGAGLRSGGQGVRTLSCDLDPGVLDLRIEPIPGSADAAVVGLIAAEEASAIARVAVMRGDEVLAEAPCTPEGAFDLEVRILPGDRLLLLDDDRRPHIELEMPPLS